MKKSLIALCLIAALLLCGCGSKAPAAPVATGPEWATLAPEGQLELRYAGQFTVDFYPGDLALINMADGSSYLLIPEGGEIPKALPENIVLLQQPLDRIYMASTSAMDLYRASGSIGAIRLSSQEEGNWYVPEAKEAMARGDILYAGKYSAPDYELLFREGCDLTVENTMIYHSPEVKEQLERLGIPVLVERSSYEDHPLGRMEWVKLHGLLTGRLEQAESYFDDQLSSLAPVLEQAPTGKTVAFFAVSTTGYVTVRKSGDYIAKTIELAGGNYVFHDLGDDSTAQSTVNLQMEAFYDAARDADVLIYNSTLNGELQTMEQLLAQSSLFADFAAVKQGQVYCTGQNLFQQSTGLAGLILDINRVLTGDDSSLQFLHPLK